MRETVAHGYERAKVLTYGRRNRIMGACALRTLAMRSRHETRITMANLHVDESARAFLSSLMAVDADAAGVDPWAACDALRAALDARGGERILNARSARGKGCTAEAGDASCELWVDGSTGLTITAAAKVFGGARSLTLGDVAAAAASMAEALDGEVLEFAMYENDGATICAYAVGFERDGEPCLGAVGFVPAPDGTVNAMMTTYGVEDAAWAAPLLSNLYENDPVAA